MSARIPLGFAEAWVGFDLPGDTERMFTSLGINLAVGVNPDQAGTDAILAPMVDGFKALCVSQYNVVPSHVIWGQNDFDLRFDGSAAPEAGTRGSGALPNNCAVLVAKGTGLGGRRGRGRHFVPGVAEADVTDTGGLGATYLGIAQTAMDTMLSALVALVEVVNPVLFHDTAPFSPSTIFTLTVKPRIATQRRRMRP